VQRKIEQSKKKKYRFEKKNFSSIKNEKRKVIKMNKREEREDRDRKKKYIKKGNIYTSQVRHDLIHLICDC
jgi:hypothetical protein